jgi:hypothetical protein
LSTRILILFCQKRELFGSSAELRYEEGICCTLGLTVRLITTSGHQGREFIANGALENGAFCTVFSEIFHKF